ncbi:MAG: hypothetical protein RID07_09685 [Lacipirellulaceae bacterium]
MNVDPPAKIAILGAGPIGLETALYARYLGYKVALYEKGNRPAASVRDWGHVQLFTPFAMNASPLGVAALQAQDTNYQPPFADECLTGDAFCDRYLDPLATSDLLADGLQLNSQVRSIGRPLHRKVEAVGSPERSEEGFRILLINSEGREEIDSADIVIDCSGTFGNSNPVGQGGVPAIGEKTASKEIEQGLPDIFSSERETYAGKHTHVIGSGYSAATNVTRLAELAKREPGTRITWLTRKSERELPIQRIPGDTLADRDSLAQEANQLAIEESPATWLTTQGIHAIEFDRDAGGFAVTLAEDDTPPIKADRIIANVGFRPDTSPYGELQVHQCYASEGPMKLAAALLRDKSQNDGHVDCLKQASCGPESLITTEPNFYVLGAKSYGRNSQFLMRTGLEQIRDLFTIIRGREDLDLYATMPKIA